MADLPHPYAAYLRLQSVSANSTRVDDGYWGMDAALEALLAPDSIAQAEVVIPDRVAATASRKERYRAKLRALHVADDDPGDADSTYHAAESRELLRLAERQIANDDWTLLQAVADGEPYIALANRRGVSAGSLRV